MVTCFQHQADLKNRTGLAYETLPDLSAPQILCSSHRVVEAMRIFHIQYSLFISDSEPL